jgi:molybdate transport system substrate-binding protein
MKIFSKKMMLSIMAAMTIGGIATAAAAAEGGSVYDTIGVFPPWQKGYNNDAPKRGMEFTVPDADNLADFHGSPDNPKLALYVGGNYFFAMAPLVHAFEKKHPEFKGRIYWETIPPGLLADQIKAGGTVTVGNMTWTVKPDVYLAGIGRVTKLVKSGDCKAPAVPYVTNTLTIMIPKGNPAHIKSLNDLANPKIKLAMPNPKFEGIGRQIEKSLEKAGGKSLLKAVYTTKVENGTTLLTHIHHRQSPLWIMQGKVQGGVTWISEAKFQELAGHPVSNVVIPDAQNTTAIYAGAVVTHAPHPKAAQMWLDFVRSPEGLKIFEHFGFKAYKAK